MQRACANPAALGPPLEPTPTSLLPPLSARPPPQCKAVARGSLHASTGSPGHAVRLPLRACEPQGAPATLTLGAVLGPDLVLDLHGSAPACLPLFLLHGRVSFLLLLPSAVLLHSSRGATQGVLRGVSVLARGSDGVSA